MKTTVRLSLAVWMATLAGSGYAQGKALVSSNPGAGGGSATARPAEAAPVRNFDTGIRGGILTVDGMVGKAQLNYDVNKPFLYFTVPGVGTAIVAQTRFVNALPQKGAFHGNTLTIQVNGHTVELSNGNPLVKEKSAEAWVAVDPLFGAGKAFPEMGYGNTLARPYVWPGSKAEKTDTNAFVKAPPLPAGVRPKPEISSSYTVTVPPTEAEATQPRH